MARTKGKKSEVSPPSEDRVVIIHLKGTPEFAAWLEEMHRETHIPKTTIVRLALAGWAKDNKKRLPPEQ